jgi:eukaryotic-like serine/threonine-protein kinase
MADRARMAAPGNRPAAAVTHEDWERAKGILDAALELPAVERSAFVAAAAGGDAALAREVESLLAANEGDWKLFDASRTGWAAAFEPPEPPRRRIGERIGAWEILEEIGHGGMGQVYLARRADDEFQKKVAIKLVRSGMASAEVLQRFRNERQISAALEHPGIARLIDGGTTARGEPYFVMEYVAGVPLLDYCRDRRLSIRDRLRLFREICAAVQYAHQHLVVHRDLKPGNVLVSPEGVPTLLDFGIAKLVGAGEGAPAGEDTATLLRILTPEYASPEQIRGRTVTTASDVYSLGVVLYELLTDEKPYRIETGDPEELLRVVCEADPERPSTRAAGLGGDLDAIVLRAMRKEPRLRYASADHLSEDIRRHLDGQPVLARRGTLSYRAGKFARRHRVGLAAVVLLVLALGGGVAATLREARRARRAEARAERRFNDVRRLANSFLFEFHDAIRDLPGTTAARALVVMRALEYLDSLAKESEGDRALRRELAEAYRRVGDVQGNPFMANLGDLGGAVASYSKAIALLEPGIGAPEASDAERATLAMSYLGGGSVGLSQGNPRLALAMARKGLALRQALAARDPGNVARQMDLSQAWQFVAFDATAAGKKEEAAAALAAQASILEVRRRSDPADRGVRRSLAQNLYLSAEALQNQGDGTRALDGYRQAAKIQEDLVREDPASVSFRRDLAWSRIQTGNLELALSNPEAALEEYGRALVLFEALVAADAKSTDPVFGVALSRHNLGEALAKLGRVPEALAEFRQARVGYEAVVAAAPSNAWTSGMLGMLYVRTAELGGGADRAAACELYAKALSLLEPIAAATGLPPDRQELFERAKAQIVGCSGSAGR